MKESTQIPPQVSDPKVESIDTVVDVLSKRIQESFGLTPDSYSPWPRDKVFTGFQGQPVHIEVRKGHDHQWEIVYVRIGERIFIDSSFTDRIPEDLKLYVGRTIIPLFALHASTLANWADSYDPPYIHAVESLDLESKGFLELGSADGVASLLAYIKGAKRIIALDKESRYLASSRRHFDTNGVLQPYRFLIADICNTPHLIKLLSGEQVDIVAANIGPHKQYGDAHLKAIELLDFLPATTFIGAGYASLNSDSQWASDQAHNELTRRGFAIREVTLDRYHAAFIAER